MSIAHFKALVTKKCSFLVSSTHHMHLERSPSVSTGMRFGSAHTWTQHNPSTSPLSVRRGDSPEHAPAPSSTFAKALNPDETQTAEQQKHKLSLVFALLQQ